MKDEKNIAETAYEDLSAEIKIAIVDAAQNRIFWERAFSKVGSLSKFTGFILTIMAGFVLIKVGFVEWIIDLTSGDQK